MIRNAILKRFDLAGQKKGRIRAIYYVI